MNDTTEPVAVLYVSEKWVHTEIGPRGAERIACKCGFRLYKSDRNWPYKLWEHMSAHGSTGFALFQPTAPKQNAPQLRRVK